MRAEEERGRPACHFRLKQQAYETIFIQGIKNNRKGVWNEKYIESKSD